MHTGLPTFWMNTTNGFDIEMVDYMQTADGSRFLWYDTIAKYPELNRLSRGTESIKRTVSTQIVNGTIKLTGSDARSLGITSGRYQPSLDG
jgi:hypothetical protein